ncbi:MAG: hypothetical protein U0U66_05165 [Cytophagaceae bacterium]
MKSINNGVSELDKNGNVTATLWFTFLYLPIIPLWSVLVKREIELPLKEFKYQTIQKIPFNRQSILQTYLYGWIIIPFLLLGPLLLFIPEVYQLLGLTTPPSRNLIKGDPLNWHDWVFVVYVIYLIFGVVKLYGNDIKRGLPLNYKDLLND